MKRMTKVKRYVKMNQEICRFEDKETNFQSGLPTYVRHGFSLICTKVSIQCPFLFIRLLVIVVTTFSVILASLDLIHIRLY